MELVTTKIIISFLIFSIVIEIMYYIIASYNRLNYVNYTEAKVGDKYQCIRCGKLQEFWDWMEDSYFVNRFKNKGYCCDCICNNRITLDLKPKESVEIKEDELWTIVSCDECGKLYPIKLEKFPDPELGLAAIIDVQYIYCDCGNEWSVDRIHLAFKLLNMLKWKLVPKTEKKRGRVMTEYTPYAGHDCPKCEKNHMGSV